LALLAESDHMVGTVARPNIVFVLTDDQDVYMKTSNYQPKIKQFLQDAGLTMHNAFANTPVCCPSRSSLISGRHIHNIPMTDNSIAGNCSSPQWQAGAEKDSFATYLQDNGYYTAYMGKYLNQYGDNAAGGLAHVPPGWNTWIGLKGNSVYYNYTLSVDGVAEPHGADYATDYLPDLLTNRSIALIKSRLGPEQTRKQAHGPRHQHTQASSDAPRSPLFLMVAPPAAHDPTDPAPHYAKTFMGLCS
jgi:N-acetylglucosamine-6-sulfatase